MKHIYWFLSIFLFVYLGSGAEAQVTNLKVNGFSSNFTMVQGDSLWWEYNLPVGGTAVGEMWVDLNGNGIIDPSTDKQMFGNLSQTDGQYYSESGPGDMDSTVNGHIFFGITNVGFAPAHYIFKFTNNSISQSISGTVTALPVPAFTVSGTVTPPPAISPQNILIRAKNRDRFGIWMALTNVSGNYTINFNSSASGARMKISVLDKFPPYIVRDTTLTMTTSYSGINFVFARPAAQIVGYLRGEDNHILSNVEIRCYPRQGSGSSKYSRTDVNGFFQFGFSLSEITSAPLWGLKAFSSGVAPDYFPPQSGSISLHQYDSLRVDLTASIADDSITGRVTVDGRIPDNLSFRIYANTSDSGETETRSDPMTGNFTLRVTKKIYNYNLGFYNLPQGYGYDGSSVQAHPGDGDIILNVVKIAWLPQTSNTSNSLRAVSFVNTTTGWVGGNNGIVLKTTNSGTTWLSQTTNTSNNINGIFFINDQTGWFVATGGMIKKTTNSGANWISQISPTANNLYAVQFINDNTGWAVGGSSYEGTLLKTTNGGSNWNSLNASESKITSLSFINANIGWAGSTSGIMKTEDGGSTWDWQKYSSVNSVKFLNENIGWAAGDNGGVYYTSNGGTDWTQQSTGHWGNFRSVDCINSSTAWIAGDNGYIFRTTDGGSTWLRQLTNKNNSLHSIQFVNTEYGWVVGDNGTILCTKSGGVNSVWENPSTEIPATYTLFQNYPNPFNPSTTIYFELTNESHVTLRVYNMLGQEVMNVVDEKKPAGKHDVQLDCSSLPSGVYFYRLFAGDPSLDKSGSRQVFVSTRKFVLLK